MNDIIGVTVIKSSNCITGKMAKEMVRIGRRMKILIFPTYIKEFFKLHYPYEFTILKGVLNHD